MMNKLKHKIDEFLFENRLAEYKQYVRIHHPENSFDGSSFENIEEQYKYQIYEKARKTLSFKDWKRADIGSGKIIELTIQSIEFKENNLVQWDSRYGDDNRPHQVLYDASESPEDLKKIERFLFQLYCDPNKADYEIFEKFIEIFGKKYEVIAYLFFLKDKSKYLPIRTTYFDKSFELLGTTFRTSHKCSWENYSQFLDLIDQIKTRLSEKFNTEIELLDAHSFAWILSANVETANLKTYEDYLALPEKDKLAINKARIGQGPFRQDVLNYWKCCSITGFKDFRLLEASHIKPWRDSSHQECLDVYNGLLLLPTLHTCFDLGLISFDDAGTIIVSKELTKEDMTILNINKNMKLKKIEKRHFKYLAYHRENILEQSL